MVLALRLIRTTPLLMLDFTKDEIGAYQPPVYQSADVSRSATSVLIYRQQALEKDLLGWTITVQTTNLNKILKLQQLSYWCRNQIDNNQDPGLILHDFCYPWVEEKEIGTRPLAQGAQDIIINTNPIIIRYYAQFKVLLHSLESPERRGAITICSFLLDELEVLSR